MQSLLYVRIVGPDFGATILFLQHRDCRRLDQL
jgi:hypothetical protein